MSHDLQIVATFLKSKGYKPELDEVGDLHFSVAGGKFQGHQMVNTYFIHHGNDDPSYYAIFFPGFITFESEEEMRFAVFSLAETNRISKGAKVFVQNYHAWAVCEGFCPSTDAFLATFPRAMTSLNGVVSTFIEKFNDSMTDDD